MNSKYMKYVLSCILQSSLLYFANPNIEIKELLKSYFSGSGRLIQDIQFMIKKRVNLYWWFCWVFASPVLLLVSIINKRVNLYWWFCWVFASPVLLLVSIIKKRVNLYWWFCWVFASPILLLVSIRDSMLSRSLH